MFQLEERKAWVRSSTHTVIDEREPDYARFSTGHCGRLQRVVRVWLLATASSPLTYVGCATFCRTPPTFAELLRLFRRARCGAAATGLDVRLVRRELLRTLRRYASQHELVSPQRPWPTAPGRIAPGT